MQDSFTIKQDITLKEFINVTSYAYMYSGRVRRFFLLILMLDAAALILGLIAGDTGFNLYVLINFATPLIGLFLLLVIFVLLLCLIIYKSRPWLFRNVSYDFTHWGVVRNGEKTEFSKPWRDITRSKETATFFIFYIGKADFHFIQKRMFKDADELADFRAFIKDRISPDL